MTKLCRVVQMTIGVAVLAWHAIAAADQAPTSARITVTGASTLAPLISDLAKSFDAANPNVRTDVQSGGSSRAITDVRKGTAQVGMVSRALYPDESDLKALLIARDGIAMVVNAANPLKALTRAQVIDIYSGKIKNWSALGGPDMPITVVSKAEGRSTLEIFSSYFGLPYRSIKAHVIVGDNQQEIMTISGAKGAIGYVSIGSAEFEQKKGSPIKLLQLDQYVPSTGNVASGAYPISRELNLVSREPLSPEAKRLLAFVSAPSAKPFIQAHFFVPMP
ncbi:phosphate ABC transporter substrate-binding protein [Variovorax sp. CCNWLW225]|uniref:phosphate ABC transporter substrate-binding protein n=1 Tax=Variovorax sp. CCNWLW225 TaxID=3127462 RepID=UPI003077BBD3